MNNAPTEIIDGIMHEFARPLAELVVGQRSIRSMTDRLTRRVRHALRRSNWRLRGTVQDASGLVQATPGRLEVVAIVTLRHAGRDRIEAIAFTIEDLDGLRIVALEAPGFRVR